MTVYETATEHAEAGEKPGFSLSRRHLMIGGGIATAALGLLPAWSRPPVLASGVVFHDRSGTGQRRAGDPGIASVLVSNGRDIVRTDADGRWQLVARDGDSIFVIKPAHWSAPLGRGGIPATSYLHQPAGTPPDLKLHYPGVAPTGPLPRSIDFALTPSPESDRFEAILIADPQPQTAQELSYVCADLPLSALEGNAQFAIVHGDVVFDDMSLYPRYLDMIETTKIAWHHCPGNHDMNGEAADTRHAFETWKQTFGPCHYAFEHASATFILLNNVARTATNGAHGYAGEISPDQLLFVRNLLAHTPKDRLIVLSMHIPLMASQDIADPVPDIVGRQELLQLLSRFPHTVSFSGHTHTSEHHYLDAQHGFHGKRPHHHQVLATMSGCWWGGPVDDRGVPRADCQDGSPRGHHVLQVDGNQYQTRFVASGHGAGAQPMRVAVESEGQCRCGPVEPGNLAKSYLTANVFDGGPQTRVTYEFAGTAAGEQAMQHEKVADATFATFHGMATSSFKSWVRPVASTHLWRAPLPNGLKSGAHRVTVRAYDEFGRRHVAHQIVEIAPVPHAQS